MGKTGRKQRPLARKDTFWNRKRIENNAKYEELSEVLHISKSAIGSYMSGQLIPSDNIARQLCDLFGVDYAQGLLEFQHAHREWKSDRNGKAFISGEPPKKSPKVVSEEPESCAVDFFKAIYGKVTYAQYEELKRIPVDGVNTMQYLYGKIDYATYLEVSKILGIV